MQAESVTEKSTASSGHQSDDLVSNCDTKGMISTARELACLLSV